MSEEIKTVEVEETEEIEAVKESKLKKAATMIGNGLKKHGKKVALIAAGAAVGFVGYALGSKHKAGDPIDVDYNVADSGIETEDNNDPVEEQY